VLAQIGDKRGDIVGLVGTERDPSATISSAASRSTMPVARVSPDQPGIDHQSVPVLHQNVPQIGKLGRRPGPLRYSRASGSVVEACVSLLRFSP
jgi:hypothetical protein